CQRISYDEYGNPGPGSTTTGQPYRYTGRRFDEETRLYYYRARYYSPELGRFLQVDPVGYQDDFNLYSYVGNDPLDMVDPSGTYGRADEEWPDKEWGKFNGIQKKLAAAMEKRARLMDAWAGKLEKKKKATAADRQRAANLRTGAS